VPRPPLQPEGGLAGPLGRRRGVGRQPPLDAVPEPLLDDAEFGHLLDDELGRDVLPVSHPAAGRILHVALAVPDQAADIELVAQDAVAAALLAADGGVVPQAATWRRNPGGVQGRDDAARAGAGGVLLEGLSDDGGLGRVDLAQSTLGLAIRPEAPENTIAVGDRADRAACADAALEAAPGLVGEVLEVERTHGALEADVEFADLALGESDDARAG